jgi:hypothetical protein
MKKFTEKGGSPGHRIQGRGPRADVGTNHGCLSQQEDPKNLSDPDSLK